MQKRKTKKLYNIELRYATGMTRRVQVRASTREVAERRALKRNPAAEGVNPPS